MLFLPLLCLCARNDSFQETHLWNISRVAERIFMKFDIRDFHEKNKFSNIFVKAILQGRFTI